MCCMQAGRHQQGLSGDLDWAGGVLICRLVHCSCCRVHAALCCCTGACNVDCVLVVSACVQPNLIGTRGGLWLEQCITTWGVTSCPNKVCHTLDTLVLPSERYPSSVSEGLRARIVALCLACGAEKHAQPSISWQRSCHQHAACIVNQSPSPVAAEPEAPSQVAAEPFCALSVAC